jgi:hypothetical protein
VSTPITTAATWSSASQWRGVIPLISGLDSGFTS